MAERFPVGSAFPALEFPRAGGGTLAPAAAEGWRLVSIFRGKFCPFCNRLHTALDERREKFAALGVSLMAISADDRATAEAHLAETGWHFPLGYGLDKAQMQALGLYMTLRQSPEGGRLIAEPACFLINPQGLVQIADFSNAPFARPDLDVLLLGIKAMQDRNLPILGTAE